MNFNVINNIESYMPLYILSAAQYAPSIGNTNDTIFKTIDKEGLYIENDAFSEQSEYFEGSQKTIIVNAYERNPRLRKACIEKYGTTCNVCGFSFEEIYGSLGRDFIEVHHLIPLCTIHYGYIASVDDLRPVCSNCHSMLHKLNNLMTITELKQIIKTNSKDVSFGD